MPSSPAPFDLALRVKLWCGADAFRQLPDILERDLHVRAVGIVVDGNALDGSRYLQETVAAIEQRFSRHLLLEYREPFEPTYDFLDRVAPRFRGPEGPPVDCVVGIGGGSALDSAKALATLATNPDAAIRYRGFPTGLRPSLPIVAVPTTAGTGSEVTFNAVFTDEREQRKLGINSPNNYPAVSILDPRLVVGAPRGVIVSSGLDALVHTLEGFVSRKASELSRVFSAEAFRRIMFHLPRFAEQPDNPEHGLGMQIGAALAMLGMSNSSSGPAGGLSYYLGTHFKVPHGMAGAVFIGQIMALNHRLGYYGLSDLAGMLPGVGSRARAARERSRVVVDAIRDLLGHLGIPDTLAPYGVLPEHLEGFYQFATVTLKGAFELNAAPIPPEEIRVLLERMTSGTVSRPVRKAKLQKRQPGD